MESFPILLLGETGVGKSQAAAALGRSAYIPFDEKSGQFEASFLDIYLSANISEYPETLVESELFGHKKVHSPALLKIMLVYWVAPT